MKQSDFDTNLVKEDEKFNSILPSLVTITANAFAFAFFLNSALKA